MNIFVNVDFRSSHGVGRNTLNICCLLWMFIYLFYIYKIEILLTVDVGYVPNAKYLANIPHQTQKTVPIRCCIYAKIIPFVSVPLQICNGTNKCGKTK